MTKQVVTLSWCYLISNVQILFVLFIQDGCEPTICVNGEHMYQL